MSAANESEHRFDDVLRGAVHVVWDFRRLQTNFRQARRDWARNGPRPREINGLGPKAVFPVGRGVGANGLYDFQRSFCMVEGGNGHHVRFVRRLVVCFLLHVKLVVIFQVHGVNVCCETVVVYRAVRRLCFRGLYGTGRYQLPYANVSFQLVGLEGSVDVHVSPRHAVPAILRVVVKVVTASVR